MAAPIYTQAEADELIAMPKVADYEAWQSAKPKTYRQFEGREFRATAEDRADIQFVVEVQRHVSADAYSVTLRARIQPRPFAAICRYDIQDLEHQNPPGTMPSVVESGVPHKHVYSETFERKRGKWDAWAIPLYEREDSPEKLLGRFIKDMRLSFSDNKTHTDLFEFMNP